MTNKRLNYFALKEKIIEILIPRRINNKRDIPKYNQSQLKNILNNFIKLYYPPNSITPPKVEDVQMEKFILKPLLKEGAIKKNDDDTYSLPENLPLSQIYVRVYGTKIKHTPPPKYYIVGNEIIDVEKFFRDTPDIIRPRKIRNVLITLNEEPDVE